MNYVNIGFIFKYLYVWTHKRVVLSCEALSVKSGHFSHWRAAFWAASPALQYPSKVSPTSWLRGALKALKARLSLLLMFLFLPYTNTNTNCEVHQALLTGVEDLKRQVCQSDRLVTWTTRDIKESGENRGMTADFLNSSSPVISYALTSHNKLAECLWIPSLVYHFLPASSRFQPALRDFYILNPFFCFFSCMAW